MYNKKVTVCIAAFAENGKKLVTAADQMISLAQPIAYQYETEDVSKIYDLKDNCVCLTAGVAVFAQEIVDRASRIITAQNPATIEAVAEIVRKEYSDLRKRLICQMFLEPRGLTLDSYYKTQSTLNMGVIQELENRIANESLGVDLIVAGLEGEAGHEKAKIFSIGHPGLLVSQEAVGYWAVGIGAPHAVYSLIDADYKRSLEVDKVKELVEKAKERSEKAPGVGKQTKVRVLPA